MPIILQRKLKCKFTGSDDYLPEDIPREKFMPIVGYEYRKREVRKDDKSFSVEDLYYQVINSKGKIISLASFNCNTMIDENAEINAGTLMQLLNNISLIGKVLSEQFAKTDKNTNSEKPSE